MTWVVNFHHLKGDVYVGRPSKFGNPFRLGSDGSREEVLILFEGYLFNNDSLLKSVMTELPNKQLACWCHPMLCHAHILARVANGHQLIKPLEEDDE